MWKRAENKQTQTKRKTNKQNNKNIKTIQKIPPFVSLLQPRAKKSSRFGFCFDVCWFVFDFFPKFQKFQNTQQTPKTPQNSQKLPKKPKNPKNKKKSKKSKNSKNSKIPKIPKLSKREDFFARRCTVCKKVVLGGWRLSVEPPTYSWWPPPGSGAAARTPTGVTRKVVLWGCPAEGLRPVSVEKKCPRPRISEMWERLLQTGWLTVVWPEFVHQNKKYGFSRNLVFHKFLTHSSKTIRFGIFWIFYNFRMF